MKIVNLCLCSLVTDGWTYQDNTLPKYHQKNGHNTTIITSEFMYSDHNIIVKDSRKEYINEDGVKVVRLKSNSDKHSSRFKKFYGLYEVLEQECPDIMFIHNFQFVDIKEVVKYLKKHENVKVYADNHADFLNSASNWLSKNILHKIIWRHFAKMIEPYVTKFYGVVPARADFLKDVYKLPEEKVELLVMGADDEKVEEAKEGVFRGTFRKEHNIKEDDFIIISGGKIDKNKPETLELMRAVSDIKSVKLVVFGSVVPELKAEFDELCQNDNIIYIGWISSKDVYKYFEASDLAIFPGKHSVLWEQAVGMGTVCVFRKLEGFTHVDVGGNCLFIENTEALTIKRCIENIIKDKKLYYSLKENAKEKGTKEFSYKEIAKRSIL